MEADVITKADIEKRRREIEAEALAEVTRRKTRGEADAFLIQKKAEGDGIAAVAQGEASAVVTKKKAEGDGIAMVGEGEGRSIRAKLVAEAEGTQAILQSKAQGFERLVAAAGGEPHVLPASFDGYISSYGWVFDSQRIIFLAATGVSANLYTMRID
ncbi:MAG: hypothetical protein LBM92_09440, partial [Opitutaceae bacterium]|nr:hypothetical protein [Opitutaceae bacterium]